MAVNLTAYLEVRYGPGSLERTAGSLLSIKPSTLAVSLENSSVFSALAYWIIIKMIALKSNSQVNGTLLSEPLYYPN